jgi:hypothetical protein
MPVMSIVGCEMFEDEIVYLIQNDPTLDEVIVVENENSVGLAQKLNDIGYSHAVLPLAKITIKSERKNVERFSLIVYLLEIELDSQGERLKDEVYKTVDMMVRYSDSILVFYGLCGNVLVNIEKDFESCPCPISILKDEDDRIVDDCICAALGGREVYMQPLKDTKGEGIYFLTPMQAARWRDMVVITRLTPDPNDIEMVKIVFDYAGYKHVAKIDTGLAYEKDFEEKVGEFARLFNFNVIDLKGNLEIFENSYENAKADMFKNIKQND